ncbi:MAG TPA: flagellar hook assembly protein FlgD [Spirochaetia bacterium]|nr:flagellar hook assembly protein FlgD [Spirochaetales bacterium]HRS65108.1 flagellar hook assembly protein FlgD [Spirochaetia bacterium]HOT59425.1 flagellar hook assembly protein FlgD [Spirochaetales bacterium]HPD79691.1 flagellar hook assembly protein FlgD [Spirochaetales bacterium]HQK33319.1 flagellar hook assembly protein FlgD [Spirochaetales bacterium]
MDMNFTMSAQELQLAAIEADRFNKQLFDGKKITQEMGKDEFLKILITQLQNQDPTSPMEDKEFIAQMAQFSTLEQMTNMVQNFSALSGVLKSSEAQAMIGKNVSVADGDKLVTGTVNQVVRGDFPLILVNGKYYDLDQVLSVNE